TRRTSSRLGATDTAICAPPFVGTPDRAAPHVRRRSKVTRKADCVQWRFSTLRGRRGVEFVQQVVTICDMGRPAGPAGESRILSEIISTVGSSLELDEVLAAVVRLLSEASAVHACFVYLVEDRGERMVLRSASDPYAHLVGEI